MVTDNDSMTALFDEGSLFISILFFASIAIILCVSFLYIHSMKSKHFKRFMLRIKKLGLMDLLDDETRKDFILHNKSVEKKLIIFFNRQCEYFNNIEAMNEINIQFDCKANVQIPRPIALNILKTIYRQNNYIRNFIKLQISNKMFGVSSVVFSLISLFIGHAGLTEKGTYIQYIGFFCSFISIVCVLVALYLSPVTRVTQYMKAWKRLDAELSRINAEILYYNELAEKYNNNDTRAKAIDEIRNEANKIANFLIDVEAEINSDYE